MEKVGIFTIALNAYKSLISVYILVPFILVCGVDICNIPRKVKRHFHTLFKSVRPQDKEMSV